MNFNIKNIWNLIFFSVVILVLCWTVYCELKIHYFLDFNGRVTSKQKTPPKELPEIIVEGSSHTFPLWKWDGIEFDSVMVGDSIVKRKYESKAFWYRKKSDRTFQKIDLTYWTD